MKVRPIAAAPKARSERLIVRQIEGGRLPDRMHAGVGTAGTGDACLCADDA